MKTSFELCEPLDPETCFRDHHARVYRWAFAMCRRHADALDVTQEVFLNLVRKPPALSSRRAAIGWLRRATANRVVDRWRGESARTARELAHVPREESEPPLETRELCEHVRAALLGLSEQQRIVLMAKCYDQLTFQQIADEIGIAVPTAKTHYLRALAAVRDRLRPLVEAGRIQ